MKTKFSKFILIFLVLELMSCAKNKNTIVLETVDARGLSTESILTLNGFKIGNVNDLLLGQDPTKVIVNCKLDNKINVPIDSKFKIQSGIMLGAPDIKIELGTSNKYIGTNDTLLLTKENSQILTDTLAFGIGDFFERILGTKKQDSILIELRRLNNNLEKITNKN